MLLADSHITMVVGVLAPADYIPFLGTNVSVNGLKCGVSDVDGMIVSLMRIL